MPIMLPASIHRDGHREVTKALLPNPSGGDVRYHSMQLLSVPSERSIALLVYS
jgi:hypothetical protein